MTHYLQIMAPRQNFQEKWLANDAFRPWLARVPNDTTKAYCQVCHKHLSAEISSLKRHRESRLHMSCEARRNATAEPRGTAEEGFPPTEEEQQMSFSVAYATVLFVMFLAEHNLPFR